MGILLSRFRKKKTTLELLEELDKDIKVIEQYGQNTEQRHKKIVGTLIIYSIALYIITALVFYFRFFPAELYDQVFYMTPLLIFPILILFTKRIVSWYYKRKISKNHDKLQKMQTQKKKILEEVTETETYKKAKEILLKFAPDQLKITSPYKQSETPETPKFGTPQAIVPTMQPETELRRRTIISQNVLANKIVSPGPIGNAAIGTPQRTTGKLSNVATPTYKSPLPRPILPQQRNYVDKLIEYVVGDGPNNRYALICRQCDSHNGMALKEEFGYFAFRCCYCNFWNPARKQKPSAPKLECDNDAAIPRRLSFQMSKSTENLTQISAKSKISPENENSNEIQSQVLEKKEDKVDDVVKDEDNIKEENNEVKESPNEKSEDVKATE
ncbi:endoplasmic reticulum junction formation protein lunapark [Trichogramma pretiosum]|uniref:endoplasmic reticulum junction formation protein lunapark n=1 Tax=Trichogramma pretiosum TaxID=7493 RepID=UPI0006C9A42A|nr:endoplasmic reticulum junction formation protein lunapark [Trichogramma pretiosum]